MEKLYVKFLIWASGIGTNEGYEELLNELFTKEPDNSLLLELELISSDISETRARFLRYFNHENALDTAVFGKDLFSSLERIYRSELLPIADFAVKCNLLSHYLPQELYFVDPFYILSYIDDPLGWNDEKQVRELCEKAFGFYK